MTDMNDLIRRGAGRAAPGADAEPSTAASEFQVRAAREIAVPLPHAHRLQGDDLDALKADARELPDLMVAQGVALSDPEPVGSFDGGPRGTPAESPPSMNALIRAHRDQLQRDTLDGARAFDHLRRNG